MRLYLEGHFPKEIVFFCVCSDNKNYHTQHTPTHPTYQHQHQHTTHTYIVHLFSLFFFLFLLRTLFYILNYLFINFNLRHFGGGLLVDNEGDEADLCETQRGERAGRPQTAQQPLSLGTFEMVIVFLMHTQWGLDLG